ncbi:MAG TPA: type II toxin-antitoxin system PemK/MazF family toxin [Bryobacteraceae bacterium]|nr:type II toxin-antitoxin system PemK/MazF family toxin [Bryobacteraceae bacterium]
MSRFFSVFSVVSFLFGCRKPFWEVILARHETPVVLPITSGGNFARTAGFAVPLAGTGIKTTGVVRCDQPQTLDLAARGAKKLESVPDEIMGEVLARISPLFE